MSHFDSFFKANYLGMCRYCESFGHSVEDVQEVVADVIHRHFDAFLLKIEDPQPLVVVRRWLNRRALLDLADRRRAHAGRKTTAVEDFDEVLCFDDPAQILELKQALPEVLPDILFTYETHQGDKRGTGHTAARQAERDKFSAARNKFMKVLRGQA